MTPEGEPVLTVMIARRVGALVSDKNTDAETRRLVPLPLLNWPVQGED